MEKMAMSFWFLSLFLISVTASSRNRRVINGHNAARGQFPYMARLERKRNGSWRFWCGGSLIHNGRHVLTAKHCVDDVTASNLRVVLGDHRRLNVDPGEQTIRVSEITRYNNGDLAVLKLTSTANTASRYIGTIDLAEELPAVGQYITVAGWGWTSSTVYSPANTLQTVEVPRQTANTCNYQIGGHLDENEFCFGDSNGPYTNICHGDSGGPVVTFMSGDIKLLGVITSTVVEGCHTNSDYAIALSMVDSGVRLFVRCATRRCGCFPSQSLVQEKTNGKISIEEVQMGDEVLAMNDNDELVYSEVIMFLHREPSTTSDYYIIQTGEASLHVSARHLVRVAENGTVDTMYKYAQDVSANDLILIVTSNGWKEFPVLDVSVVHERGVYAPLTTEGTIVVDGVVTSCYASVWSHDLAHLAFLPVRFLYKYDFFGWASFMFQPNNHGIAWYPQFLMDNVEPFVSSYLFGN